MKTICILATAAVLSAPASWAVLLNTTFTNLQGETDRDSNLVFSDNTGATIAGNTGFVAIGTFTISNTAISSLSSAAALDAAFYDFGSSSSMGSFGGTFSAASGDIDPDTMFDGANTFTGSNLYMVIGDGASLATSSVFLVWDSGVQFENTDPSGAPDQVVLDVGSGTLVVGLDDKHTFDLTSVGGSATQPAFTAVELVPEPSSTALLGLGGVALFLRRRR